MSLTLLTLSLRLSSGLRSSPSVDEITSICLEKKNGLRDTAVTGNDKVAQFIRDEIRQYDSLEKYRQGIHHKFGGLENFQQITANQTSFTALSSTGKIYTWGDLRYEACLGREVSNEKLASEPCVVEDMLDLPDRVIKISSGGYATAALTSANDVYFWGQRGHYPEGLLTGYPTPLDLNGQNILDVAVGFDHIMILTTERRLFAVGDGSSGQLGQECKQFHEWKEISLPVNDTLQISSIHAGYKTSFVLKEDIT